MGPSRGEVLLATSAEHDAVVLTEITDRGLDPPCFAIAASDGAAGRRVEGIWVAGGTRAVRNGYTTPPPSVTPRRRCHVRSRRTAAAPPRGAVGEEHVDLMTESPNGAGVIGPVAPAPLHGEQDTTSVRRRVA